GASARACRFNKEPGSWSAAWYDGHVRGQGQRAGAIRSGAGIEAEVPALTAGSEGGCREGRRLRGVPGPEAPGGDARSMPGTRGAERQMGRMGQAGQGGGGGDGEAGPPAPPPPPPLIIT